MIIILVAERTLRFARALEAWVNLLCAVTSIYAAARSGAGGTLASPKSTGGAS